MDSLAFSREVLAKMENLHGFGAKPRTLLIKLWTVNNAKGFQEDVFASFDSHNVSSLHTCECPKAGILQEQCGAGIKAGINKDCLSQFEEWGYEAILKL
jgi:hypothetical protein